MGVLQTSAAVGAEAAPRAPAALTAQPFARTLAIPAPGRLGGRGARRGRLVRSALGLTDALALAAAFAAATVVIESRVDAAALVSFAATLPGWLGLALAYRLYDRAERRADHRTSDELTAILHVVAVGTLLFLVATVVGLTAVEPRQVAAFAPFAVTAMYAGRGLARWRLRRHGLSAQTAIIVGTGDVGQRLARKLIRHPELGIQLVGFVDARPPRLSADLTRVGYFGTTADLPDVVELLGVDRVLVAFPGDGERETLEVVRSLRDLRVQIDVVPRLFEVVGLTAELHRLEGMPLVNVTAARLSGPAQAAKRAIDLAVSSLALVVLGPLLAAIAVAIRLETPGPVFFRQLRVGAADRPFRLLKFRTMVADADERKNEVAHLNKFVLEGEDDRMFKAANDPRVTRVGAFLRRYSLDELPQLINVLRGQMSLVGPRPLILSEDEHVESWGRKRLDLKPGITGLWQVLGRNEIPFAEMVRLDYLYVTSWSPWLDVKLMLRTVPVLLRGSAY